jgi:hypothetical protein
MEHFFNLATHWLPILGGGIAASYTVTSASARVGLVPGRMMRWWDRKWRARIEREDRDAVLAEIASEFQPNHGSSLRDAIDNLSTGLHDVQLLLAQHIEESTTFRTNILHQMENHIQGADGLPPR